MEPDSIFLNAGKAAGVESVVASALFGIYYPLKFFFQSFLNVKQGKLLSVTIFVISVIILFFFTLLLGIVRRSLLERKRVSAVKEVRNQLMGEARGLTESLNSLVREVGIEVVSYEACIRGTQKYDPIGWKNLANICDMIRKQSDACMNDVTGNMVRFIANSSEFKSVKIHRDVTLGGVTNIHQILDTPTKNLRLLWKAYALAGDVKEVHLEQFKASVVQL